MKKQVEKFVEQQIRPYLKAHHGDLSVESISDGIVNIKLYGACSGCPHSDLTTKDFIEEKLIESFSWVKEIVIVRDVSPELITMAKEILNRNRNERKLNGRD